MAETIEYRPCWCGCQPLVLTGCGCKVCLLGKMPRRKRGLREILKAAGIDAAEPHYCLRCNNIVLVISIEQEDHWAHICKPHGHGWRTESPI